MLSQGAYSTAHHAPCTCGRAVFARTKGNTIKKITAFLCCLLLAACSTTSQVQVPYAKAAGQQYSYTVANSQEMGAEGLAIFRAALDEKLRGRSLLAADGSEAATVEISIGNYYMRHGAARALVGIMAGRDNIRSTVRILDAGGKELGKFDVESTNATAWGTSSGMIGKHAEEIVARL